MITAFRNAPRHRALFPILDLPGHRRFTGLIEQRVIVGRHHQERHQVFEHRTAPGEQDRFSTGGREQTPQGKPALLRQLPLRNRDEAGKPRFRSQEIVVTGVPAVFTDIVADRQQMTRLIEQEIILHPGKDVTLQGKPFDRRNSCSGVLAGGRDEALEFTDPGAFRRRGSRAEPMIDLRQELFLQRCQFAQCGDFVEIGKASDVILRRQELCPWSERRQLIEGISTLPGEGLSPPPQGLSRSASRASTSAAADVADSAS